MRIIGISSNLSIISPRGQGLKSKQLPGYHLVTAFWISTAVGLQTTCAAMGDLRGAMYNVT